MATLHILHGALFFNGNISDCLLPFPFSSALCLLIIALSAVSASFRPPEGVGRVKRMPLTALGFLSVLRGHAFATQYVLACGDGFQVGWVDTALVSAEMIEHQLFWYGADELFVQVSVGSEFFSATV